MSRLDRRAWIAGGLATAVYVLGGRFPAIAAEPASHRIVTIDWTVAETLLRLGITPLAMCETEAYRRWVVEPALPPGIHDLGLRIEPNLELLQQLAPDVILITPQFDTVRARLAHIGPVRRLGLFDVGIDPYDTGVSMARLLVKWFALPAGRFDDFKQGVDDVIDQARSALAHHAHEAFLVVQFIDHRLLRVFDTGSLYDAVLQRVGLRNAWTGPATQWGFQNIGLDQLIRTPDAVLICIEPLPPSVESRLARSPLWNAMPFVQRQRTLQLPPVWSFGGLAAAERFARLLTQTLAMRRFT